VHIDNPLHGRARGALFGPQKGADAELVRELDAQLRALDEAISRELGLRVADLPGAGRRGRDGRGHGWRFYGARLQPGIEAVLDTVCLRRASATRTS
jgi:glycerate kinase